MTGQGKETEDPPWRAMGRGDRAEGTGDLPWRGQDLKRGGAGETAQGLQQGQSGVNRKFREKQKG